MKTKILYLNLLAFFLFSTGMFAQTSIWAEEFGDNLNDVSNSIVQDDAGNIYITGAYEGPLLDFGTGVVLTNSGGWDCFTAKFDPSGNILWAESSQGINGNEYGNDLAVDAAGNVYVIGSFDNGNISFDGGASILTNSGGSDFFVVKYNSGGVHQWSVTNNTGTGTGDEFGEAITEHAGTFYITGSFNSSLLGMGPVNLASTGGFDIFISDMTATGAFVNPENPSGSNDDFGKDISFDGLGNIYVTGYFKSPAISFSPSLVLTNADPSGTTSDAFAARKAGGSWDWATNPSGDDNDISHAIAVDISGMVYMTGTYYSSSLTFGTPGITINNPGTWLMSSDYYLVKYDPSLASPEVWVRTADANADPNWNFNDVGKDLAIDNTLEKVYVTGWYNSNRIDFGHGIIQNATNNNYSEFFLCRYGFSGTLDWVAQGHAVFDDRGMGVDVTESSCPVITGWFKSDDWNLAGSYLTNAGGSSETSDIFINETCGYDCNPECQNTETTAELNTGTDMVGMTDPTWMLTEDPSGPVTPEPARIVNWFGSNGSTNWSYGPPLPGTNWISSDSLAQGPEGTYVFTREFSLDNCVNPVIQLCLMADDSAAVYLNGAYLGSASSMYTPAYISSDGYPPFITGVNTLEVHVYNLTPSQIAFNLEGYVCCGMDPCDQTYIGMQKLDSCEYDLYISNDDPDVDYISLTFSTGSGHATIQYPDYYPTGWTLDPSGSSSYPVAEMTTLPASPGTFSEILNLSLIPDPAHNPQQVIVEWMGWDMVKQDTVLCYDTLYFDCPYDCPCTICEHPMDSIMTGPGASGTTDPTWEILASPTGAPTGPAINMGSIPATWGTPFDGTNWISYQENGGGGFAPVGPYTYMAEFSIPDQCQGDVFMKFCVMVDDTALIHLNGSLVHVSSSASESDLFTISGPFNIGAINQLKIDVINSTPAHTGLNLKAYICCDLNTGMQEPYSDAKIRIYPNPAHNMLYVESSTQPVSIHIYNHTGQLIKVLEHPSLKESLNISGFPAGLYILKIKTTQGIITKKIVKR